MLALVFLSILSSSLLFDQVSGHGYVLNPVGRASRWRFNSSAPINWDDDQVYCGSFGTHWNTNGGKCGFCGDDYRQQTPRAHEHGGTFGQGVIVNSYTSGGILPVEIRITANHAGHFEFSLCNMDYSGESEECFNQNRLKLRNGAEQYPIQAGVLGLYNVELQLPTGLTCRHCVLRWIYVAGNNWGCCEDGRCQTGCGPQEHFRACSDIAVNNYRIAPRVSNSMPEEPPLEIF